MQVQDVYATRRWTEAHAGEVYAAGGNVVEVDDASLARLSSLATPNNVLAVFSKPWFEEPETYSDRLSLVIDGLQDPGNLGTIIRCADWFGIRNIICSATCADAFNSKVIQATMGSITRVHVTVEQDLSAFLELNDDVPVIAAALEGDSIYDQPPAARGFLLIGNESRGISEGLLERATHRITIPRTGAAESLNAAVATAILLSHLSRP